MDTYSDETGYCAGFTVYLNESKVSSVLGPDGEPIKYTHRNSVGFNLNARKVSDNEGKGE